MTAQVIHKLVARPIAKRMHWVTACRVDQPRRKADKATTVWSDASCPECLAVKRDTIRATKQRMGRT